MSLVIFLFTVIAGKFIQTLISRVFTKLAKDRRSAWNSEMVRGINQSIYLSILGAGFFFAFSQLTLPELAHFFINGIIKTVLIITWAKTSQLIIYETLKWFSKRKKRGIVIQPSTLPFFENIAFILIWGGTIYFTLISWDVDLTAWMASAGIIGIALGFAAKDSLANFFAGIFIIADSPYKIGDFIILDGSERGKVTEIGIRSTRMLTPDDVEITIPNSIIGNSKIINITGGPYEKSRVKVQVGVSYSSDIDLVREILYKVGADSPLADHVIEPKVRFMEFGDSSLNFELWVWAQPEDLLHVKDDLNSAIFKAFKQHNITIPFPQVVVHKA
mgnify:FL=1